MLMKIQTAAARRKAAAPPPPAPEPWPPPHLALPDTIEAIERGRPEPPAVPPDDSREGRLARLLGTPGIVTANQLSNLQSTGAT